MIETHHGEYKLTADQTDWRDLLYTTVNRPLKKIVDLRPWASAVEDQKNLGSCTSNAACGVYELLLNLKKNIQLDLSRLFVYYNSRLIDDTVTLDQGAYIRDVIKALKKYGVCTELLWPYQVDRFAVKPDPNCYTDAIGRTITNYYRLVNLDDVLDALNNDHPIIIGILVYESFELIDRDSYVIKLPNKDEEPVGGHSMCLVGYDLDRQLVLARNSFGLHWGQQGYCWIPFEYVKSEIIDMWIFDVEISI